MGMLTKEQLAELIAADGSTQAEHWPDYYPLVDDDVFGDANCHFARLAHNYWPSIQESLVAAQSGRKMTLLHLREWVGPSRYYAGPCTPRERMIGLVTRLPLQEALRKLAEYQQVFSRRFGDATVVEFNLLTVSQIDDLSDDLRQAAGLELVEDMAKALTQTSTTCG